MLDVRLISLLLVVCLARTIVGSVGVNQVRVFFSFLHGVVHFQDDQDGLSLKEHFEQDEEYKEYSTDITDMFERFKSKVQESLRAQEEKAAKQKELISTLNQTLVDMKDTIEEQAATILEMNRTIEIVAKHPILSDFIQRSMAKATKGKSKNLRSKCLLTTIIINSTR